MDKILNDSLNLKNEQARQKFRAEAIEQKYSPYIHLGVNASLLITTLIFHSFRYESPSLLSLLAFPIVLFLGNLAVYLIHRYPLHGFYRWNSYSYGSHTRRHHVFFKEDSVTFRGKSDWFTIFFPNEIVAGFVFIYHPLFYFILKPILGHNTTTSYLMASSIYFILYEVIHYSSHLPSDHFMMRVPLIKIMRKHHQIHHSPRIMGKYNFCIVYPLFDYIFNTHLTEKDYHHKLNNTLPKTGDTDL
jgi:hypothetical protein